MKPKQNEAKTDFLKRCTKSLIDGGEDSRSAMASCTLSWNKTKGEFSNDTPPMDLSAQIDSFSAKAGEKKRTFMILAKTSEPLNYWGETLHIDIDGIRTEAKIPILREHDRKAVVGSGASFVKENSLFIEGNFSDVTETAKEVKALADEGYPWQASIGIWAERVEYLESEKAKAQVNGKEVTGPAYIWRESFVRETSFVTLGTDDRTAAISFDASGQTYRPSNEPVDFGQALELLLREGNCIDEAIRLAAERYPTQYQKYCQEILNPLIEYGLDDYNLSRLVDP